jgi:transposase
VAETARILGCTRHGVDKLAKAYRQDGLEAVGQLKWGSGRPLKFYGYTQMELDKIVSKQTTRTQAGLSMKARAIRISEEYGKPISAYQLKKLYKGRGVSEQKPQVRGGRPHLQPIHEQAAKIADCKRRVMWYISQGYELITIDECIFSPKQVTSKTWAPIGDPILH